MSNPFSDDLMLFDKLRSAEILCWSFSSCLRGKFIEQSGRESPDDEIFARICEDVVSMEI